MVYLLAIVLSIAMTAAAFADSVVTACDTDIQIGAGTNLSKAVRLGGTISFDCKPGTTIRLTQAHQIRTTTEIDGARRITLDVQGPTRRPMFFALGGVPTGGKRFTLRNIALRRGGPGKSTTAPDSPELILNAMIWSAIDTSLFNVEIRDSVQPIKLTSGKLTIVDSTFFTNTGPVLEASNMEIRSSRFVGTSGSAMQGSGGTITLDRVQVAGNRESTSDQPSRFEACSLNIRNSQFFDLWTNSVLGGALMVQCSPMRIAHTSFTNNRAQNGGGLAVIARATDVELRSVTFTDNQSLGRGGGVLIYDFGILDNSPPIRFVHAIFRNNRAQFGGAISLNTALHLNAQSNVTVLHGTALSFKGNVATGSGGALYGNSAQVKLARAVFLDNQASSGGNALMMEGAVTRPFLLANSIVARSKGPGAAVEGILEGEIINSTIVENESSGISTSNRIGISNTVLSNNQGGNCLLSGSGAEIRDAGTNVQFPRNDCGISIRVADPQLDTFFVPAPDSVLRRSGNNATCLAQPVNARDVYGQRRPRMDRCTIGAVEGDIEQLVRRLKRGDKLLPNK
jgi:predicted outer membrane repeat protein